MATYLVTWNPGEWAWEDLPESSRLVKLGNPFSICWSCGNTKKIKEGDRIFLLRQGIEPKGICASGYVIQGSFTDLNWKGNESQYIEFEFDTLLNPEVDKILPRHLLNKIQFSGVHWDTQRSGITIPENVAVELEKYWTQFSNSDELRDIQQKVEIEGYFNANDSEDARLRIRTSIVQRRGQSEFRHKLLSAYGGRCPITNCDVEAAIEAAHIIPYRGDKSNHITNGLPLRADIHTLFDLHLLSIHPDTYEIIFSPKLVSSSYWRKYAGQKLRAPQDKLASPDRTALSKHYETFLKKQNKQKQNLAA